MFKSLLLAVVPLTLVSSDQVHHDTGTTGYANLIPNGFSALRDYEVLEVRQEEHEDVVFLRKRGNTDCDTDCFAYSAWTDDSVCSSTAEEVQERSNRLTKRDPKKGSYCNVALEEDGAVQPAFELESRAWPSPEQVETNYKRVYDTGDPANPLDIAWYKVSPLQKRWTESVPGREGERCYEVEHVLEWQMLKIFIEDKTLFDGETRCQFLQKYFVKEGGLPKENIEVDVAKNHEQDLTNGKGFEYKKQIFELEKSSKENLKPMDWIALQWPGLKGSQAKPPSPWEYEYVVLHGPLNNKKADIWSGSDIFADPKLVRGTTKMSQKNKANSKTLEWLFEDKYFNRDEGSTPKTWPEHKGKCKAVSQFTDVMGLVYYHDDPYIRAIMRAQVERIGNAWEYLETKILPGTTWIDGDGKPHPFQAKGLKQQWLEFMKKKHSTHLKRIKDALKAKVSIFEGNPSVTTKVKRWDFLGLFSKRVATVPPNCGTETDSDRMKTRVELLLTAYDEMPDLEIELVTAD